MIEKQKSTSPPHPPSPVAGPFYRAGRNVPKLMQKKKSRLLGRPTASHAILITLPDKEAIKRNKKEREGRGASRGGGGAKQEKEKKEEEKKKQLQLHVDPIPISGLLLLFFFFFSHPKRTFYLHPLGQVG